MTKISDICIYINIYVKDEENFGSKKPLQISSYVGQCATSTVSTAKLEPSLHNF